MLQGKKLFMSMFRYCCRFYFLPCLGYQKTGLHFTETISFVLFLVVFFLLQIPAENVSTFYLDLEDHSSIPATCQSMLEAYGKVDILINNAGISCHATVLDLQLETYKKVMNINFFGQVAVTKGEMRFRLLYSAIISPWTF